MSDNGGSEKTLVNVELKDNNMIITFGKAPIALLSHAIRLASLQLDNMIVGKSNKAEVSNIIKSNPTMAAQARGLLGKRFGK